VPAGKAWKPALPVAFGRIIPNEASSAGRWKIQANRGNRSTQATMTHAQLTESVRAQVAETFATLGNQADGDVRESVLIRAGNYCGRRFSSEGLTAIWFVEENQVKFYGPNGQLLQVVDSGQRCLARAA
jgi:hypothetical protein